MKFIVLAWSSLLYYYKSSGDNKYVRLFSDTEFLSKLRKNPSEISEEEFDRRVVLGFISDIGIRFAAPNEKKLFTIIKEITKSLSLLGDADLLTCDLSDEKQVEAIKQILNTLNNIKGLWITGISKIAHLLSDKLFVAVNVSTLSYFGLFGEIDGYIKWLEIAQQNAREVTEDFSNLGFEGTPEEFLSDRLGYTTAGCRKSLARFIDEYFWIKIGENLPVPPRWIPPQL